MELNPPMAKLKRSGPRRVERRNRKPMAQRLLTQWFPEEYQPSGHPLPLFWIASCSVDTTAAAQGLSECAVGGSARQHGDTRVHPVLLNPFLPFSTAKVVSIKATGLLIKQRCNLRWEHE
jgi:hypothetical protein